MKVLSLISPEYVEKILNRAKKFEFRRGIFKKPDVKSVVTYSTMPVGKAVTEFDIVNVVENELGIVWEETS